MTTPNSKPSDEDVDGAIRKPWHAFTVAKHAGADDYDALTAALNAMAGKARVNAIIDSLPSYEDAMAERSGDGAKSQCTSCGEIYPRAPKGHVHKCGRCSGGMCQPIDPPVSNEAVERLRKVREVLERDHLSAANKLQIAYRVVCQEIAALNTGDSKREL